MICSTLSGQMAIKHPKLGILVREDGCVLSRIKGSKRFYWNRGSLDKDGYRVVGIRRKVYRVHRLVAECFIPNPDNKPTVDHIDRNRQNNAVSNLRWASRKEQADNSSRVLNRKDYGARPCEDAKTYHRLHHKEYYVKNRTELKKYNDAYYKEHRDEILEKKRLAYAAKRRGTS